MLGSDRLVHYGGKRKAPMLFGKVERTGRAQICSSRRGHVFINAHELRASHGGLALGTPGARLPDHRVGFAVVSFLAIPSAPAIPNPPHGPREYWGEMRLHPLRRSCCLRCCHSHSERHPHRSGDGPLRPLPPAALGCGGAARALQRGRKSPRARERRAAGREGGGQQRGGQRGWPPGPGPF